MKKKTFQEMMRENPDSFDYMDSPRPGRYPRTNMDNIKKIIAERRGKKLLAAWAWEKDPKAAAEKKDSPVKS